MTGWKNTEFLDSPSGAKLTIRKSAARHKAKAIIHINHGMAEHSARYKRFADALNKAGYHAIAHDHRGHGETTAPDAPRGVFSGKDGVEKVLTDCLAVNSHARETWPDLPILYFGHSMGGIIGTTYCIRHSDTIDGAILWNFNVDGGFMVSVLAMMLKIERALKGSDVPSGLATKLTFEDWNKKFKPNRTECDWLSRDGAEVDKYVADPDCGFPCSVGLWLDVIKLIQTGARDSELNKIRKDLPVNILGGRADPSSTNGKSMERLADRLHKVGLKDVVCTLLPETRHETLNEINHDEETKRLIGWLNQRFG